MALMLPDLVDANKFDSIDSLKRVKKINKLLNFLSEDVMERHIHDATINK